jgi:hypothetical protein
LITVEFITELRKVHHLFEWKYEADTNWPGNRRARTRLRIRAVSNDAGNGIFDPIGAVCYAKTGQIFDADSWIAAANTIQLSLIDAADITATANQRTWKADGDGRVLDPYLISLRESLANTVGLQR